MYDNLLDRDIEDDDRIAGYLMALLMTLEVIFLPVVLLFRLVKRRR